VKWGPVPRLLLQLLRQVDDAEHMLQREPVGTTYHQLREMLRLHRWEGEAVCDRTIRRAVALLKRRRLVKVEGSKGGLASSPARVLLAPAGRRPPST
jgi:hypothetical protein